MKTLVFVGYALVWAVFVVIVCYPALFGGVRE